MPYSKPPEKIKDLPKHAQDVWVAAFNAAFKQYNEDDAKANAVAWAAVKKAGYAQDDKGAWHKTKSSAISELWEQVKRLFEPHLAEHTEYLPTETRAFIITRSADGIPRWLLIAASAVVNRVNAIDSTTLFDNFIKHARASSEYPALDFLHQENNVRLGQADWLARDGALYLASGTFDDTDLARGAVAGLESDPAYWGASISYSVTEPPLMLVAEGQIPVYQDGVNNFISIVPKRMAANLFTAATVAEEVIRMDKKTFDELVRLVGPAAAQQFADQVDDANRTITDTGMVTRSENAEAVTTTTPAEAVQVAAVTETQPTALVEQRQEPPVEEPAKPAMTLEALAARLDALEAKLAELAGMGEKMEETARALTDAEQKRATTLLDGLTTRLASVEESKARWDQWLDDAPEYMKQESELFRARNQPAAPMTAAQIAEQTVSRMSKEPLRRRMPQ